MAVRLPALTAGNIPASQPSVPPSVCPSEGRIVTDAAEGGGATPSSLSLPRHTSKTDWPPSPQWAAVTDEAGQDVASSLPAPRVALPARRGLDTHTHTNKHTRAHTHTHTYGKARK